MPGCGSGWKGEETQSYRRTKVSDVHAILTAAGRMAAVRFQLLVCLTRRTVWLRDGENRRGKQPWG